MTRPTVERRQRLPKLPHTKFVAIFFDEMRLRDFIHAPLPGRVGNWRGARRSSVAPFPVPATSHVACGFPALRVPAHFATRVMRPSGSEQRPRMALGKPLDTH